MSMSLRFIIFLLLPILVVLAFAIPALAQDTGTSVDLGGPAGIVLNYVVEFVLVALLALATLVARWLKEKFDIDTEDALRSIEAKHRETLHWAITTGIRAAIAKFGVDDISKLSVDVRNQIVADAVRYVRDKGAPEAFEFFGVDMGTLSEMALSKLFPTLAESGVTLHGAPIEKSA